jgi:hypothetical protein
MKQECVENNVHHSVFIVEHFLSLLAQCASGHDQYNLQPTIRHTIAVL